jgi:hypothetical protein
MSKVGRDWRFISHGVANKKYEAIIASNIQLSIIDQRSLEEDETHKQIYGWNENGSDKGSLLVDLLQVDGGRSVANYENRTYIFGRNAKLLGAKKTENENCRR